MTLDSRTYLSVPQILACEKRVRMLLAQGRSEVRQATRHTGGLAGAEPGTCGLPSDLYSRPGWELDAQEKAGNWLPRLGTAAAMPTHHREEPHG